MRVLLVDEEHALRAVLRLFRRQIDRSVVGVRTAGEALEILASGGFDAAIVDHHLVGEMSGATLLEVIAERWPNMRRVLCTGRDLAHDEEARAHAHVVLPKPATLPELLAALDDRGQKLAAAG